MRQLMLILLCSVMLTHTVQAQTGRERLQEVKTWFYYIAIEEGIDEIFAQVIASDYDMVVIDPVVTEVYATDYDIASQISAMQATGKIVIAYIDIGQAEDYRTYWQTDWRVGNPDWIRGDDPDGWVGNYPVAYWYDEWQAIWFNDQDGIMPLLIDLDFDGVYLDWVEAYSDENVVAFAQAEGLDPIQEMVWFIEDIATYGRNARSDFIVIGQNAAELAYNSDYVQVVDAIAQEQIWFDGGAEGIEGDCPLPATDADIDNEAYINSLSSECRDLYINYPESTLHVSSEGYLEDLHYAQEQGMPIFTVDYALQEANIALVYEWSRAQGFVPFVGNRPLNQYVAPR
jgi:cysteinyl-tRNA synthetase